MRNRLLREIEIMTTTIVKKELSRPMLDSAVSFESDKPYPYTFKGALAVSTLLGVAAGAFAIILSMAAQKHCPDAIPSSMPSMAPTSAPMQITEEILQVSIEATREVLQELASRSLRGNNPFPMQWSYCEHGTDVPPVGLFVTIGAGMTLAVMLAAAALKKYPLPSCSFIGNTVASVSTTTQQTTSCSPGDFSSVPVHNALTHDKVTV